MSRQASSYQRFGIDLIQAAKNELEFLKLVSEYPNLCKGPVIKNAIRRYELLWLPFASAFSTDSIWAAPLDIAWIWHVHMLSPRQYEHDCLNIASKVLDHSLLVGSERNHALCATELCWRGFYRVEPFEVDLTKPPKVVSEYRSRIQCNLEEACYHQFKFYYQVSLPQYSDDLFLKSAVERYEHLLQLKILQPEVFMVACYDVHLIWHAHQLHPLNYTHTTTELLGRPLHHDDTVTGRVPGAALYDSRARASDSREGEGLWFAKAGAMYRGDPPDPRPPTPNWLYAPLSRLKHSCEILGIEVLGMQGVSGYVIQVENLMRKNLFRQELREYNRYDSSPRTFILDNDTNHAVVVKLSKSGRFGMKSTAESQVDFLPYFQDVPFDGTAPDQSVVIDVPLCSGKYTVKLTVKIDPMAIVDHCFKVQPEKKFLPSDHPSMILSCPELMLSPSDLARESVPCDSSTHSVLWRGYRVFSYRVVHSSEALLSALEIINLYGQVVASAYTVKPNTFPERSDVQDQTNNIFLNQHEGERGMLIRGNNDWGLCIGGLTKRPLSDRGASRWPYYVNIKVFKLFGERGWCSVQKLRQGVFVIKFDSDTMVRIDLKLNKVVISPRAQNIPQILALAFSVSILHLLCIPYRSHQSRKSSPCSQLSHSGFISPSFYSAGYLSSKVPTNVYLSVGQDSSAELENAEDRICRYDFNAYMF